MAGDPRFRALLRRRRRVALAAWGVVLAGFFALGAWGGADPDAFLRPLAAGVPLGWAAAAAVAGLAVVVELRHVRLANRRFDREAADLLAALDPEPSGKS